MAWFVKGDEEITQTPPYLSSSSKPDIIWQSLASIKTVLLSLTRVKVSPHVMNNAAVQGASRMACVLFVMVHAMEGQTDRQNLLSMP